MYPLLFSHYIPAVSHSVSSIIMSSKNEMFKRRCLEYINKLGGNPSNLPDIIQQSLLQMLKYKDKTEKMGEEDDEKENKRNNERNSECEPIKKRRKLNK